MSLTLPREIMTRAYLEKSFAHFYVIQGSRLDTIRQEVAGFFQQNFTTSGMNDYSDLAQAADVFWITAPIFRSVTPKKNTKKESKTEKAKRKGLTLEDLQGLGNFLDRKPLAWPHRFILLESVGELPVTLSNKLLKTMEELALDTTLILLYESTAPLLPTVQSRAQVLSMPWEKTEGHLSQALAWVSYTGQLPESGLLGKLAQLSQEPKLFRESIDKSEEAAFEELLFERILDWSRIYGPETLGSQIVKFQEELLALCKWMQVSRNFHNPASERIFSLLNLMHIWGKTT